MVDITTNIYANNYYMVCLTKSILDLMVCYYDYLSATFNKVGQIHGRSACIMLIVGLIYVTASILIHLLRIQHAIMTLVLDLSIAFKSRYVSLVVDACKWNTCSTYSEGPPVI